VRKWTAYGNYAPAKGVSASVVLDSRVSSSGIGVIKRNDIVSFVATGVTVAAAAGLHFAHANDVLTFVVTAATLSLLAMNVSHGTE
jgi:hypothetical protein